MRRALSSEPNLRDVSAALRSLAAQATEDPLAISTLRGEFADNGEWRIDPARPAVIVGTVDMIGSRLLFSGYALWLQIQNPCMRVFSAKTRSWSTMRLS